MEQSQLLAHCGSSKITREELKVIPTPEGSATHQPVPHFEIVGALVETLGYRQISVVREEYAVSSDGMKMFGVLDLETTFDGCRFSVGVRNSNDKSMRLALTVGYRVLVCDNMAFHGDFTPVLAKHTKHLVVMWNSSWQEILRASWSAVLGPSGRGKVGDGPGLGEFALTRVLSGKTNLPRIPEHGLSSNDLTVHVEAQMKGAERI